MTERKPNWAFRVRLFVLLSILLIVAGYAVRDVYARRSRTDWKETLTVAVVLLELEPVERSSVSSFAARLPVLEQKLGEEARRYRADLTRPFELQLFGPVQVREAPPEPRGESFIDLATHAYRQWRYVSQVDEHAGVASGAYDARLYVTVRAPKNEQRSQVEGFSQHGGRIGTVSVELADHMVDLGLLVVAHELLHTLGATDKYDARGRALLPLGLADPDKVPLFPQTHVEIMARNRPLSLTEEAVPESLEELRVGGATAREIGWIDAR